MLDETPATPGLPDLGSEADIEVLVRAFYRQAAVDDVLGPVFAAADVDWAEHIPKVTAFWNWQLLGGRRYDGRPLRAHERVNGLVPFTEAHYERWLELFGDTLRENWSGPVADTAERRAERMARSMRRVLAGDDDPEPSWAEEGVELGSDDVTTARPGGVVMQVALGPRRRPGEDD
ncbi:MAG TPA: group III truncated hemoglobin [Acidimicrobiales bacterium]